MTPVPYNPFDTDPDPEVHASSPTDQVCESLRLYGYAKGQEAVDPRHLPDLDEATSEITGMMQSLYELILDTSIEDDLGSFLWDYVQIFHRRLERTESQLDSNEQAQKTSVRHQNGSEVRSLELETLITQGQALVEHRDLYELFRDHAASRFELLTGTSWKPRSGSFIHRQTLTAAMIDSRDFLSAEAEARRSLYIPKGTRIAFAGGVECEDYDRIFKALDRIHARHTDMILLHGGGTKGAEKIASLWAENRKITQIIFKPDWAHHQKSAPFKRNDQLLKAQPIGLLAFKGNGIVENLIDKAMAQAITVWRAG